MRKILFPALILGIILTMSCEQEPEEEINPFVGTWEQESRLRYVFANTTVKQYDDEVLQFSGTYTYNDTHITINTDYRIPLYENAELYPNPFVWTYRFEGDTLMIGIGSLKKVSGAN